MDNLTDLEIIRKIAKIEGATETHTVSLGGITSITAFFKLGDGFSYQNPLGWNNYNPLTDKALCFDLMVKYKVKWTYVGVGEHTAISTGCHNWCDYTDSAQKAICLSIIEAHND